MDYKVTKRKVQDNLEFKHCIIEKEKEIFFSSNS